MPVLRKKPLFDCLRLSCWRAIYSTIWLNISREADILNHMVDKSVQFNAIFHALAHESRREMLIRLASDELTIGRLAEPLAMSFTAASKHVQVLERAGLVSRKVEGRRHICRLEPGPLESASQWLHFYERFWGERLDAQEVFMKSKPITEEED